MAYGDQQKAAREFLAQKMPEYRKCLDDHRKEKGVERVAGKIHLEARR